MGFQKKISFCFHSLLRYKTYTYYWPYQFLLFWFLTPKKLLYLWISGVSRAGTKSSLNRVDQSISPFFPSPPSFSSFPSLPCPSFNSLPCLPLPHHICLALSDLVLSCLHLSCVILSCLFFSGLASCLVLSLVFSWLVSCLVSCLWSCLVLSFLVLSCRV